MREKIVHPTYAPKKKHHPSSHPSFPPAPTHPPEFLLVCPLYPFTMFTPPQWCQWSMNEKNRFCWQRAMIIMMVGCWHHQRLAEASTAQGVPKIESFVQVFIQSRRGGARGWRRRMVVWTGPFLSRYRVLSQTFHIYFESDKLSNWMRRNCNQIRQIKWLKLPKTDESCLHLTCMRAQLAATCRIFSKFVPTLLNLVRLSTTVIHFGRFSGTLWNFLQLWDIFGKLKCNLLKSVCNCS